MGSIWEAAVKSFKTLLLRTVLDRVLTHEDLKIILYKVTAALNAWPLSSMSSDPSKFKSFAVGHFLTMRPIVVLRCPQEPSEPTAFI